MESPYGLYVANLHKIIRKIEMGGKISIVSKIIYQ